jgi:P-type conjugative transfer protein TrbJ
MTSKRRSVLACLVLIALVAMPSSTQAIPVFDPGNFAQNLVSAIELVDQSLTQVMQYQNQLLQYEEMVRNGLAPAVYTWDRIVSIQNKLHTIASTLRNYRHWVRDLDDYLSKFADLDYYRSARCYGSDLSCPESEWERILRESQQMHGLGSESRKKTLDQLMRTLETSEQDMVEESANLEKLQREAQAAKGHMQALQAGNQLASAEVNQLMQIRIIMVAQYRAIAVQLLVEQTREAQQAVAGERYRRPMAQESPKERWDSWPSGESWR